jgi:hypothetical protein
MELERELAYIRALPKVVDPLFDHLMSSTEASRTDKAKKLFPNPPFKTSDEKTWVEDKIFLHDRYYTRVNGRYSRSNNGGNKQQ